MVSWYEGGVIKVEEFGLDTQGEYYFHLNFVMYSYVPTVLEDSTWQDPTVQHAEGPLASKIYKIKIIVGNCPTGSFSLSIPDELPENYEI